MDNQQRKRPSLRGLGKQIMRGAGEQPPMPQDQPEFQDDEAVRQWMQAQTRNEIPDDWVPADEDELDTDTLRGVDPTDLGVDPDLLAPTAPAPEPESTGEDIYADPNFDDIFRQPEPPPPPPQVLPDDKTQILDEFAEPSLDELFRDETPEFDAIFGDVVTEADLQPPAGEHTFLMSDEIPEMQDEFLAAPPEPAEELRFEVPEPEEHFSGLIGQGVNDYAAPRSDRRSLEQEQADTQPYAYFPPDEQPDETLPQADLSWLDEVEQAQQEPFYESDDEDISAPVEVLSEPEPEALLETPEFEWLEDAEPVAEGTDEPAFAEAYVEPAPPELQADQNWLPQEFENVEPVAAEESYFAMPPSPEPPVIRGMEPEIRSETRREAVPPIEVARPLEPVDLRNEHVYRGALAGLTPQEPEEFTPGQRPASYYESDSGEKKTESFLTAEGDSDVEAEPLGEKWNPVPPQQPGVPPLETADDLLQDELGTALEEVGGSEDYNYDIEGDAAEAAAPRRGMLDDDSAAPFDREATPRKNVVDLIRPIPLEQTESDPNLLKMLVNDTRIKELFNQIDALQEEVVSSVRGDRGFTDAYQEDLLAASNLLTRSRENYDEARAIVFRVRADLNRERRVEEDVLRYRPVIWRVYAIYAVMFLVLLTIGQAAISLAERGGIAWIGQGYYPALFGGFGALLFSYKTLNKHTINQRDFDAVHVSWYLFNPLVGVLFGFLMYLVFVFTILPSVNLDVTDIADINSVVRVDVLLAFIAGYNQNTFLGALDTVRQRFTPTAGETAPPRGNEK